MAGIKLGSTDVTAVKLGSTDIQKIYRGTDLVFELASLDPDAQAFLTATGITDPTQTTAINDLVLDLKSNSLWSKMIAVYPFVGGTATTHKYNLMNPLDTDAAFRLTFAGGWTHSANGIQGNTTNTYGDTHWSGSLATANGAHLSININLEDSTGSRYDMGSATGGDWALISNFQGTGSGSMYWQAGTGGYLTSANTGRLGFYTGTSNGTNFRSISKNGTQQTSNTSGGIGSQTTSIYVGATNLSGTPGNVSGNRYDFCSIGEYLTTTDISNLETIQTNYNTALSR